MHLKIFNIICNELQEDLSPVASTNIDIIKKDLLMSLRGLSKQNPDVVKIAKMSPNALRIYTKAQQNIKDAIAELTLLLQNVGQ